jgi:hypothetical protein
VKALRYLIYACFVLILVGGVGTIGGLIAHADRARLPFMYVLVAGLGLFAVTLVAALVMGAWAYFSGGRKSLSYFSGRRD